MQEIKMCDYDNNYKKMFLLEKTLLEEILKENLSQIHHIGSTAIVGIKAKPIIDILIVVKDLKKVDEKNLEFENLAYECMGEFGIKNRRYFRKGGFYRTHQIHIFRDDDELNIIRHLAFRDYLNVFKEKAKEYESLKIKLAKLYPYDIEKYCDGKDELVKRLEKEALIWYKKSPFGLLG